MRHEPFPQPANVLPIDGTGSSPSERNLELCATLLAQDRIIERHIKSILGTRLEFDILMDLYIAESRGFRPCLWDIGSATPLPSSTAHRRITGMIRSGLLSRVPSTGDRRRVSVRLSENAKVLTETTLDHRVDRTV
jgi:DNA-binding MarR family transcriptional regulator